jgi:hypothetical protein
MRKYWLIAFGLAAALCLSAPLPAPAAEESQFHLGDSQNNTDAVSSLVLTHIS